MNVYFPPEVTFFVKVLPVKTPLLVVSSLETKVPLPPVTVAVIVLVLPLNDILQDRLEALSTYLVAQFLSPFLPFKP